MDFELQKQLKVQTSKIRVHVTSDQNRMVDKSSWEMTAIRNMVLKDSPQRRLEERMLQANMIEMVVIRAKVDMARRSTH